MTIAAEKVTQLNAAFDYTPVLALVTGDLTSITVTADNTTDTFTAVGHGLVDGVPLQFSNVGGALPGGVVAEQNYFVITSTADTFQMSETIGGAAIAISSDGSGTNTATEQELGDGEDPTDLVNLYDSASQVWDIMVRHEVADYQGAGRISFTWPDAVRTDTGAAEIAAQIVSVIPTTGDFDFRYSVILRGANTTVGDSTGSVAIPNDLGNRTAFLEGVGIEIDGVFPQG